MNTEELNRLEQQRRRARIDRMKVMIIRVIVFWMTGTLIAIAVLFWQTVSLRREIRQLKEQISGETVMKDVTEKEQLQKTPESQTLQVPTGTEPEATIEPETAAEPEPKVKTGIDSPENMAGEGDSHKVYLTFDGAPDENTEKILAALKKNNVKATFFVSGAQDSDMEAVYREIVADGHTLGMNSFSNQYSEIYKSVEDFTADYKRISDYLFRITGLRSTFYRFPGGSGNEVSNVDMSEFVRVLNNQKVTYFDWNVAAQDTASDYTAEDIVSSVVEGVKHYKTSVVLLHNGKDKSETAEAIGPLIEALKAMDAQILPIDEETDVIQYIKADSVK